MRDLIFRKRKINNIKRIADTPRIPIYTQFIPRINNGSYRVGLIAEPRKKAKAKRTRR